MTKRGTWAAAIELCLSIVEDGVDYDENSEGDLCDRSLDSIADEIRAIAYTPNQQPLKETNMAKTKKIKKTPKQHPLKTKAALQTSVTLRQYNVAWSRGIDLLQVAQNLTGTVNQMLAEGWKVDGGVCVLDAGGFDSANRVCMVQAMTRTQIITAEDAKRMAKEAIAAQAIAAAPPAPPATLLDGSPAPKA